MPEPNPPEPASSEAAPEPRTVIIGVISAPGNPTELPSGSDPISPSGPAPGYRLLGGSVRFRPTGRGGQRILFQPTRGPLAADR